MEQKILALDIGGTVVKAALYTGESHEDRVLKKTSWKHDYRTCGLKKAKKDLSDRVKGFCDCKIDAIGLSIAGLIATDNSLYRSTVLTSFTGFNIPKFLKKELNTDTATIDNDADCGAINEYNRIRKRLFYVVVGSGIGSAYVNERGNLPYSIRFHPRHIFSDRDNPIPNDLGLQLSIPKSEVYSFFSKYGVKKETMNKVLVDEKGEKLTGPNKNENSLRIGVLGSALGLKKIINILLFDKDLQKYFKSRLESQSWVDYSYRLDIENDSNLHGAYLQASKALGRQRLQDKQ